MRRITLLPKEYAVKMIPKVTTADSLCYYLSEDYDYLIELRKKFSNGPQIRSPSGLFQKSFEEIKEPFLELVAKINKERNCFAWWGTHLASRSTTATPLLLNITYLFCAKKILTDSDRDIIFVIDSVALSQCLSDIAVKSGCKVINYRGNIKKWLLISRRGLFNFLKIIYFLWHVLRNHSASAKFIRALPPEKKGLKTKVVIRSWVTNSNFDKAGKFKDRNFGNLLSWFYAHGYEVWILPMFFNLSMSMKEMYTLLKNQEQQFLIPERYLKFSDYLWYLYEGYKGFRKRIEKAQILDTNITPMLNEILKKGFDISLLTLNLCCPMLKRLKEAGYDINAFYYAFECNVPEKQFVLSCRKYFPEAKIIGFQHTAFFPSQLTHHLGIEEHNYYPLPDKIICSGPIYLELHKKARFPAERLVEGPNLRFESVYANNEEALNQKEKALILPLTFSPNLVFELFAKVNDALRDCPGYKVYIRSHPLLSKKILIGFMDKIGMDNYEFADKGIIQDWLPKVHAVVSIGCSITILEAVSFGTPVIRVMPDGNFLLDPFIWPDYPLKPVSNSLDIAQQVKFIDKILEADKDAFRKIAKEVLRAYFTKPSEENLKVFLASKYPE